MTQHMQLQLVYYSGDEAQEQRQGEDEYPWQWNFQSGITYQGFIR